MKSGIPIDTPLHSEPIFRKGGGRWVGILLIAFESSLVDKLSENEKLYSVWSFRDVNLADN